MWVLDFVFPAAIKRSGTYTPDDVHRDLLAKGVDVFDRKTVARCLENQAKRPGSGIRKAGPSVYRSELTAEAQDRLDGMARSNDRLRLEVAAVLHKHGMI